MSTATIACGPVPSSRVMHCPTVVVQGGLPLAREYSTSSSPRSAPPPLVTALFSPAIRPLPLRSERMRRVVAVAWANGIAYTPVHPGPPTPLPDSQVGGPGLDAIRLVQTVTFPASQSVVAAV